MFRIFFVKFKPKKKAMTNTQLTIQNNQGIINLFYDNENAGLIEFNIDRKTIDILHTEVDPKFGGKGLGKILVMAAVDYAKEKGLFVKTSCTYAQKVFEKNTDLQAIWQK
jgi:predicted GNAT family acetyltransferase